MKKILLVLLVTLLFSLSGCKTNPDKYEDINQENMTIFTKQQKRKHWRCHAVFLQ